MNHLYTPYQNGSSDIQKEVKKDFQLGFDWNNL